MRLVRVVGVNPSRTRIAIGNIQYARAAPAIKKGVAIAMKKIEYFFSLLWSAGETKAQSW